MSLQIRLYVNWRGYERTEVIEVNDKVGMALVERNIGEIYVKPKVKKVRIKDLDEDTVSNKMLTNYQKKTTAKKDKEKEIGKKKK